MELYTEIEKIIDPADLLYLSDDDYIYAAKCTVEAIKQRRRFKEKMLEAKEKLEKAKEEASIKLMRAKEVTSARLYTVPDMVAMLKCSRQKVYQLVAEKKIPHVKVEGSVRFVPEDIAAWLDSNKIAAS